MSDNRDNRTHVVGEIAVKEMTAQSEGGARHCQPSLPTITGLDSVLPCAQLDSNEPYAKASISSSKGALGLVKDMD